ncbi:tetratricopeptide repeat protein [Mucisphaera sp.]|uniref:tetratricopeptide repeat protein n=1 Tax=Mucisphaera sp. TaxID=2913024 RepID=UPI003D11A3E6
MQNMKAKSETTGSWAERELTRVLDQCFCGDRLGAELALSDLMMEQASGRCGEMASETAVLRRALEGRPPESAVAGLWEDLDHGAEAERSVAEELTARPGVILTLVKALDAGMDKRLLALVRRAGSSAYDQTEDRENRLQLCQGLARLALLAGDRASARAWAERGLKLDRASIPLALVLSELEDSAASEEPTRIVLTRAVRAQPGYRDVRAALIRRRADDGRRGSARRMLQRWLEREPDSVLARRLAKDLVS